MKRAGLISVAMVAGSLFLMGGVGCESEHVYSVTGTYSDGYYDYYYYPESEVYYAPSVNLYYWRDRDEWREGRELPRGVAVDRRNQVNVRLQTNRPYTMHAQVQAQHPWHHER
jgi:hypothetical protein